jgi:hypothetical protein
MQEQNDIGEFEIGDSQLGTLPFFDFNKTIISQYANSPILYQLIESFNSYLDQTENIDNFFDILFNIDTAQGIGLDILGRIVGVSRVLQVISGTAYFSFAGTNANGEFGQAPFYSGQPLTGNYALSDSAFRTLILAKALANISDCSVPSINKLLQLLFPNRGAAYVVDNENMSMTYHFGFPLTLVEQSIVVNSNVLPRPSGVSVSYSY